MDADEHALDLTSGVAVRIAGDNDDSINLYEWMCDVIACLESIEASLATLEILPEQLANLLITM